MSKNQIQQFQNQHFGNLTVIEKDGEFFFIGKQVAEMLGYSNASKAVINHVSEEDKTHVMMAHSQNGNLSKSKTAIINESGLYSLILSSKLPQAKAFKHWVTKEVLPSIRKHGGYIHNQEEKSNEEILAGAILVAQSVILEKERQIEELQPKAEYFDNLVDRNLSTNFRNTAKELHIPQKKFIDFLLDNGFLYRDKNNTLLPYAKKNDGYFEIKEWYDRIANKAGIQTVITPKGRQYLLFLIGGDVTCD